MRGYLRTHPCERCGESDWRALTFHHRDPSQKVGTIAKLVSNKAPLDVVIDEIAKCDVLCANCHQILHHEERGEYGD